MVQLIQKKYSERLMSILCDTVIERNIITVMKRNFRITDEGYLNGDNL